MKPRAAGGTFFARGGGREFQSGEQKLSMPRGSARICERESERRTDEQYDRLTRKIYSPENSREDFSYFEIPVRECKREREAE